MKQYKEGKYTTIIEGSWCEISDGEKVIYSGSCLDGSTPEVKFKVWKHRNKEA